MWVAAAHIFHEGNFFLCMLIRMAVGTVGAVPQRTHRSIVLLPPAEDIMTTDAIYYALQLIGIDLTDHIIVAKDKAVSLAEIGVIKKK